MERLPNLLCLSIRQPWAWLIVNGHKDIENRGWPTNRIGKILIHAGKGMTRDEYDDARDVADDLGVAIPKFGDLERGGIVGRATISGCVDRSRSPWFFGPYGFVLVDAAPLPFVQCRGQLGFFRPEYSEPTHA